METHDYAQLGVAEVAAGHLIDAAPALHLEHVGKGAEQIAQRVVGNAAQLFKAQPVALVRFGNKVFVSRQVLRAKTCHLIAHACGVATVVKPGAIVKTDPVKRLHGAQVYVIGKLPSGQRPQLVEHEGCSDDGGAGVKRESVLSPDICPSARRVQFFEYLHAPAFAGQADSGSQSTKTAADDDGAWRAAGECLALDIESTTDESAAADTRRCTRIKGSEKTCHLYPMRCQHCGWLVARGMPCCRCKAALLLVSHWRCLESHPLLWFF